MLLRNLGEVYKKGLPLMSDLYDRIETLCKENNESITTMCRESGASRASLSDLKVGRKQSLSAETLSKIAAHFGVSVDYLLGKSKFRAVALFENMGGISAGTGHKGKAPTETGERDILDEVDVAFYGDFKELDEDEQETVRDMVRLMRQRKEKRSQ
jgi:transcriptional regulator with XRE-family HTH domain